MIKTHEICSRYCKDKAEIQARRRIWQKENFGTIVFPEEFWSCHVKEAAGRGEIWILGKVIELNNKRFVLSASESEDKVFEISPEDGVYNYIDEGRKIYIAYSKMYVFVDIHISDLIIRTVAKYSDRDRLNLKKINTTLSDEVFLIYNEDIEKIKRRLAEIRTEKIKEKVLVKEATREVEKIKYFLKDYRELKILEDDNIKIEENVLIDKQKKLKLIFTKRVVDLFSSKEILNDYVEPGDFIKLSFHNLMEEAADHFNFYNHNEIEVIKWFEKRNGQYTFKLYSCDSEGKDIPLIDFSLNIEKGKSYYRYFIDNIQIPKRKVSRALSWFYSLVWNHEYNTFLQNIKRYSGTQLEFLKEGITGKVYFARYRVPYKIKITNPKREVWEVTFGDLSWRVLYSKLKECRNYVENAYDLIIKIGKLAGTAEEIEDYVLSVLKQNLMAVLEAEEKAKKLWQELEQKYPDRILKRDGKYIVKGRFRTYQLSLRGDDVEVTSYPDGRHICINAKTKIGAEYPGYDKLVQYGLALLNDAEVGRSEKYLERR